MIRAIVCVLAGLFCVGMVLVFAAIGLSPPGIWKGSAGMLVFGLFFAAFAAPFGLIPLLLVQRIASEEPPWLTAFAASFLVIPATFVTIGLGIAVAAVKRGRTRAVIDVTDADLLITTQSPFGARQRRWRLDRLDMVEIHGNRHADKAVALRIIPLAGRPVPLLAGRRTDEVDWIVSCLRLVLEQNGSRARMATTPADKSTADGGTELRG